MPWLLHVPLTHIFPALCLGGITLAPPWKHTFPQYFRVFVAVPPAAAMSPLDTVLSAVGLEANSPSPGLQAGSGLHANEGRTIWLFLGHPFQITALGRGAPSLQFVAWFIGANSLPTSNFGSVLQVSGIFVVTGGSEIIYGHGHDLHCQHLEYGMTQPSHEMRRWRGLQTWRQTSTMHNVRDS